MRIPYFRQTTEYTCGAACVRMLLAAIGTVRNEKDIAQELKTSPKTGTSREQIVKMLRASGLSVKEENGATAKELRAVLKSGPVLINYIEPTHDAGHYALAINGDALGVTLKDPWLGDNFRLPWTQVKKRWAEYQKGNRQGGWMLIVGPPAQTAKRAAGTRSRR